MDFFNIFANINVSLLEQADSHRLMTEPLDQSDVVFSPEEQDFLLELAGRHPYFLQVASHFLFEGHKQLRPDQREGFVRQFFRDEAAPHMSDYWHNSDDYEKIVLTAIALLERGGHGGSRNFHVHDLEELCVRSEQTIVRLAKRGLVVFDEGEYALFNSYLGGWIVQELSAALKEQQTYDHWLNANKSLMDKLSEKGRSALSEVLPKIGAKYRDLIITWASDPDHLVAVVRLLKSVLTKF